MSNFPETPDGYYSQEPGPPREPIPLRVIHEIWRAGNPMAPSTGEKADKAFFDELSGEDVPSQISREEQIARQRGANEAYGNINLSGFSLSPEAEAIVKRYIKGDLTTQEMGDEIRKLHGL